MSAGGTHRHDTRGFDVLAAPAARTPGRAPSAVRRGPAAHTQRRVAGADLESERGLGASALVADAMAAASSCVTLRAAAEELERDRPFAVLSDLLLSRPRVTGLDGVTATTDRLVALLPPAGVGTAEEVDNVSLQVADESRPPPGANLGEGSRPRVRRGPALV